MDAGVRLMSYVGFAKRIIELLPNETDAPIREGAARVVGVDVGREWGDDQIAPIAQAFARVIKNGDLAQGGPLQARDGEVLDIAHSDGYFCRIMRVTVPAIVICIDLLRLT